MITFLTQGARLLVYCLPGCPEMTEGIVKERIAAPGDGFEV